MTSFVLKIIAVVCMFLDHYSAVFEVYYFPFRYLGRLTMPIMCFLVANGYRYTKNLKKYIMRMLAFGAVTEVFFNLALFGKIFAPQHQNVLFTFALGLAAIHFYQKAQEEGKNTILPVAGIAVLAEILRADYGAYGIVMIIIFYITTAENKIDIKKAALYLLVLNLPYLALPEGRIQGFSMLALVPIYFYNGRQGLKVKYFFYIFYPLHLAVIYSLTLLK